ncbi:MAG: FAD-binding oxidoreductase, partial [Hyphomicrobiales bacterium]
MAFDFQARKLSFYTSRDAGTAVPAQSSDRPDRRAFMRQAGVFGAWLPFSQISVAQSAGCALPPAFPEGMALYRQAFKNWAGDIAVDDVWTCAPASPLDVVRVVNWARRMGYKVRPRGMMHNWSPFTLPASAAGCERTVLLDTTRHLTAVSIDR